MTNSEKLAHILKLFELRYVNIYEHSLCVSRISETIAHHLGIKSLRQLKIIKDATFFHDVGKIFIPDKVLLKKGSLNSAEFKIMKTHIELGIEIMSIFFTNPEIIQIAAQHHEAYDGSGYPSGLSGTEICIGARICSVADSFETIYHGRTYCSARTFQQSIEEINRYSGTKYDPAVVEAFNQGISQHE